MFLKRQIPIIIVIAIGFLTLSGHFIKHEGLKNWIDNDSTQWFDIIASFAIVLGALNLLKLQFLKVINKKRNWQYSVIAIGGFFFAIFCGFLYRGTNYVTLSEIHPDYVNEVAMIIAEETEGLSSNISDNLSASLDNFDINKIYIREASAVALGEKFKDYVGSYEINSKKWGIHVNQEGSLFSWMFFNIFTPLSATMFALLAFFVASASYRAFRIRNFEATLLLVSGIILMLGRVPAGSLIPDWFVGILIVLGIGAFIAPVLKNRQVVFGVISIGIISVLALEYMDLLPEYLSLPVLQEWIFNIPTAAGARAIMIGIGLGVIATSFRIITGIERSYLGE